MSWINSPLNNYSMPGSVFGDLLTQATTLIDSATAAADALSTLALPPTDFSEITHTQIDPSSVTLALPTAPADITLTTPTIGSDPSDTMILSLLGLAKTSLEYRLANPTGLASSVEAAIYSRANDRETAAQAESYDNFMASQASNGFSMPSGQSAAAFIYFESKKQAALSALSREIMVNQANLEQSNVQKTLDAVIALTAQAQSLYNAQEDTMIKRVGLLSDFNRLALDHWSAKIQAYAETGQLTAKQADFLMSQVNAINAANSNVTNVALEKLKIVNAYESGRYQAIVENNKAVGGIYGQMSATCMNAMNYSTSWSQSLSWSGNESVST